MATYGYICLGCERTFDLRRPMTATVDTAIACPSCGDDRVRRRFSFLASISHGDAPGTGCHAGCACGGACACGR